MLIYKNQCYRCNAGTFGHVCLTDEQRATAGACSRCLLPMKMGETQFLHRPDKQSGDKSGNYGRNDCPNKDFRDVLLYGHRFRSDVVSDVLKKGQVYISFQEFWETVKLPFKPFSKNRTIILFLTLCHDVAKIY